MYEIYTSPGCGPCAFLKAHLRKNKIPHVIIDTSQDRAAAERVRALGYLTSPVTIDKETGENWGGVQPGKYRVPTLDPTPIEPDMEATIDLGPIDAGGHVEWNPRQGNLLTVGDSRTGKTTLQRRIIETAAEAGWQAWALGAGRELDTVEDRHTVQILTADTTDQLERIQAAYELLEERYRLMETADLAEEHPETFPPLVLVIDDYEAVHQRWADLPQDGPAAAEHVEELLLNLHRIGSKAGIHLSVSTRNLSHRLCQEMVGTATLVHTSLRRALHSRELVHVG